MIGSELQFPERYYCTVRSSFILTCVHVKRHVLIPVRMIFILIYILMQKKNDNKLLRDQRRQARYFLADQQSFCPTWNFVAVF
jgi:hypothetical protein